MSSRYKLTIEGRCYSKKNSRDIHTITEGGGRPILGMENGRLVTKKPKTRSYPGKGEKLKNYEAHATAQARLQWDGPPLEGPVRITLRIFFSGPTPDAFGPSETVFDVLEAAGVVKNDRQFVVWGMPAIDPIRVTPGTERVEIDLEKGD